MADSLAASEGSSNAPPLHPHPDNPQNGPRQKNPQTNTGEYGDGNAGQETTDNTLKYFTQ